MVGQRKLGREAVSAQTGSARPELLPGMVAPRVSGPSCVAEARASHSVLATPLPPGQLRTIGEGRLLEPGLRSIMEQFFQTDLSRVSIRQGPTAPALGALAFTLGDEIHFAPGQYDPGTRAGMALLGHELTHVVQQRQGRVANPYGHGVAIVQDPALEAEADWMGRKIAEAMWSGPRDRQSMMGGGGAQLRGGGHHAVYDVILESRAARTAVEALQRFPASQVAQRMEGAPRVEGAPREKKKRRQERDSEGLSVGSLKNDRPKSFPTAAKDELEYEAKVLAQTKDHLQELYKAAQDPISFAHRHKVSWAYGVEVVANAVDLSSKNPDGALVLLNALRVLTGRTDKGPLAHVPSYSREQWKTWLVETVNHATNAYLGLGVTNTGKQFDLREAGSEFGRRRSQRGENFTGPGSPISRRLAVGDIPHNRAPSVEEATAFLKNGGVKEMTDAVQSHYTILAGLANSKLELETEAFYFAQKAKTFSAHHDWAEYVKSLDGSS